MYSFFLDFFLDFLKHKAPIQSVTITVFFLDLFSIYRLTVFFLSRFLYFLDFLKHNAPIQSSFTTAKERSCASYTRNGI